MGQFPVILRIVNSDGHVTLLHGWVQEVVMGQPKFLVVPVEGNIRCAQIICTITPKHAAQLGTSRGDSLVANRPEKQGLMVFGRTVNSRMLYH